MIQAMILKNYCIEVPLNGITSIQNFMKSYQAVQKLLVGDRQTGDLISLLSFLESRLKKEGENERCSGEVYMFHHPRTVSWHNAHTKTLVCVSTKFMEVVYLVLT
jgi:hypothetical protein